MLKLSSSIFIASAMTLLMSSVAVWAQATRTWVSGIGDDANPCSRTAPCKTFAGAISKTLTNGEINCIDPGGFGAVTITKSITIDCTRTLGSILASGTNGISINITTSAATDPLATVQLRGISINGTGVGGIVGAPTGIHGISVAAANTRQIRLLVDDVTIRNFTTTGILFNGPGGDLIVRNSSINTVTNGSGIRTLSTLSGALGVIHVTIDGVSASSNQQGVRFEGNTRGTVKNTIASNNTLNGVSIAPVTIGNAEMNVVDSVLNGNRQFGVLARGTGFSGVVRLINVTVLNNTSNQLDAAASGQILSNGKNHIGTPTQSPGSFPDQ